MFKCLASLPSVSVCLDFAELYLKFKTNIFEKRKAMSNLNMPFNSIVETVYNLPLEDRLELKNLLEHNIAETHRNE